MRAERTDGRPVPGAAPRTRRRARAALGLGATGALLLAVAAAASSTAPEGPYVGVAAGAAGTLTLSVNHGTLTSFAGSTSRLVCTQAAHPTAGPYRFRLGGAVHLRNGTFAFTVNATPAHSGSMVIGVSGRKQAGQELTGTITARLSDYQQAGNSCRAGTSFETVPADRRVTEHPSSDTFGRGFTGGPLSGYVGHAGFDYDHGHVSAFNGAIEIVCPDHSRFPFLVDSAARGLDPILVSGSGAFAISGLAPLAGHGDIVQFSLAGNVRGTRASGTIRAAVAILYPKLETCSSSQNWTADRR